MTLTPDQLVEGDVLLYRGDGPISWAIRFFDGTEVNHAGLYLGNGQVGEALAGGLTRRELAQSIGGDTIWVRRLKDQPATMQPVLDQGETFLGEGYMYGYHQIVLLAFLSLTKKLSMTPILKQLVRKLLEKGAAMLADLVSGGKKTMICSEYVYRCYDQADPRDFDPYTLRIGGFVLRALMGKGLAKEFPTAPPAPGFGVHPESLLALVAREAGNAWLLPKRLDAIEPPAGPAPGDREIEDLIEQYRREVEAKDRARLAPVEEVPMEELAKAIYLFSTQLQALVAPAEKKARSTLQGALDFLGLGTTEAMFVTPGQLLKCDSLNTTGVYR